MSQTQIPTTQHAIQIVGVDEVVVNPAKPVDPVGPHQVLLQVEACGICFSDTKLLHAFDQHPRKSGLTGGLSADQLAEIPSYRPGSQPTVPGHEPVGRVVAVGEQVSSFALGDRVLVQADWKHLPTARSNGAFGYNFEGALQEYVVVDERCVVSPAGEKMLLPVAEEPSAAAVGLIEPWATVEAAYASQERRGLLPGGRVLVVAEEGAATAGLDPLLAAAEPAEVVRVAPDQLPSEGSFSDIVCFGADAAVLSRLGDLLGVHGLLNVVLGGRQVDGPVRVDVGRVHYDDIRYCGTTGYDPAAGYAWVPETGNLRPGDQVAVIGAAGPMGMMHVIRAVTLPTEGITVASVTATDLSDERLAHLAREVDPVAARHQVPVTYLNTSTTELAGGYSYLACMVPVPAVMAQAVQWAGPGAIVNAFAGIPAGTYAEIDLQHLVADQVYLLGTSGSDITDMATVLRKIESEVVDTTVSLDAVCGMAGFLDAIRSVMERTSGGKIMVFPSLPDLGLVRLADLPQQLPQVAAQLRDGRWTKAAEDTLLGRTG